MINQGAQCVEMLYNLKQFDTYAEHHTVHSKTYRANVGAFSGKQYKYAKHCKALTDKLKKNAFAKISQAIKGHLIDVEEIEPTIALKQERSLQEVGQAEPYFSNQNCLYCLPESEIIDFLQGFYDGQTHMD